jgi:hypothetical protein
VNKTDSGILARLLEQAAEEFSHRSCDQFDLPNTNENWNFMVRVANVVAGHTLKDSEVEMEVGTRPPPNKPICTSIGFLLQYFKRRAERGEL